MKIEKREFPKGWKHPMEVDRPITTGDWEPMKPIEGEELRIYKVAEGRTSGFEEIVGENCRDPS